MAAQRQAQWSFVEHLLWGAAVFPKQDTGLTVKVGAEWRVPAPMAAPLQTHRPRCPLLSCRAQNLGACAARTAERDRVLGPHAHGPARREPESQLSCSLEYPQRSCRVCGQARRGLTGGGDAAPGTAGPRWQDFGDDAEFPSRSSRGLLSARPPPRVPARSLLCLLPDRLRRDRQVMEKKLKGKYREM